MSPAAKNRLVAVGALGVAGLILGVIAFGGIEENLVYFWDVDQLMDKGDDAVGATVRLGGVVRNGTYDFDNESLDLEFTIAMAPDAQKGVTVLSKGAPPAMFREGIGVVVEGKYDGNRFNADRVIVKHSNEYEAPEAGETPQDLYRTLMDES